MKKFILLPWKSISTQEAGGHGWKAYFSYCNNIQFFMFPNNFFCIWAMVLLITGLPVVSKVGKLGGQSRCRVKQKTTDLQFALGCACIHMIVLFLFFQIDGWCVACYGKIFVLLLFENSWFIAKVSVRIKELFCMYSFQRMTFGRKPERIKFCKLG